MNRHLVLDYETRSEADLKKVGAFEYSMHPSTRVLCVGWKFGTREELEKRPPTKVWSPAIPGSYGELIRALRDPEVTLVAHNATFEQVVTRNVLSRIVHHAELKSIPHSRWICTASLAAALALPRALEGACHVLSLPVQKDMDGRRLMLKMSKPRKPTKGNSAKWNQSLADLKRVMEYCATDVDAELELFLRLPPLNEKERKVWVLDQKVNFRGFQTDRELVKRVLTMIGKETGNLNIETRELTGGAIESTNQRAATLAFLEKSGLSLPDLTAKTVSDALACGLADGEARRLLEIRQAVSKTSTAKYEAFERRSRTDGRVRDMLLYHAASTGRWGGMGVQPQNFPRGSIRDTTQAAEILKDGDLELIRLLYGNPMEVFSSCLRSVIVAPEGKELFCADYAAIEARVVFWVAKHEAGLQAFRDERDLYKEMAAHIYSKEVLAIEKRERQLGKTAVLGCAYGMGAKKFLQSCKNQGLEIDDSLAQAAVSAYRSAHHPVVRLWSNLEKAAIAAVQNPGKKFKINYTTWWVDRRFLWCELPSGRRLAYFGPEVKYEPTPWDEKRPVLYHYGVNSMTKKWESGGTYGGRLCENVIQAVARDLMAEAMLRIEKAGYELTLSVHDELVAENEIGKGSVEEFESLMAEVPGWAEGCPVKVEGWKGFRYKK